ncbi:MAG: ECF transporter S component [Oscillospiraceae bacterium]|nr:ECF transporter S component [Oscillospiraceae bacterium]
MKNIITVNKSTVKTKSLVTLAAVICAVVLPQIFHYIGAISGFGALPGATFLPIQIPIFVAGFLGGPVVGLLAGLISPLMSYCFTTALLGSAMPASFMLPYMTLELAGYGFTAGLLYKAKTPVILNLLIAQFAGRFIRAVAILAAVYVLGANNPAPTSVESIWTTVTAGLPGILLQWAFVPLIVYRAKELKKRLD